MDDLCKNCRCETHPHFMKKYHGYCLDCSNAGAPEKDDEIAELKAENGQLLDELKAVTAQRDELLLRLGDSIKVCDALKGTK